MGLSRYLAEQAPAGAELLSQELGQRLADEDGHAAVGFQDAVDGRRQPLQQRLDALGLAELAAEGRVAQDRVDEPAVPQQRPFRIAAYQKDLQSKVFVYETGCHWPFRP